MRPIALTALIVFVSVQTSLGLPRPDFSIAQDVPNSAKIVERAGRVRVTFDALDDFFVTDKTYAHALLVQIHDMFVSISGKLSTTGITLMDTLVTLANDDVGPVALGFGQANRAIASLDALLNGGLNTELDTLTSLLGPSLSNHFQDAFQRITTDLRALSTALGKLQVAIGKAQAAAGNGPVTVALVRQFVASSLVSNVQAALESIGNGLQPVMSIIERTAGKTVGISKLNNL